MCNDKDKRELSLEEQETVNGGVGFVEEVTGNPFPINDIEPIVLNPKTPTDPPFGPVDPPPGSVQPCPDGPGGGFGPIQIRKDR